MMLKETVSELEDIVEKYTPLLYEIPEADITAKTFPNKWSKKEILGHLIDSVQNNARRFVVAQYEDKPHIVYAQDAWVAAANYQQYSTADLIQLWSLLNKHACIILKNIPEDMEQKECVTSTAHSIEWLAADYNKHLLHHLHQILGLEPVAYP